MGTHSLSVANMRCVSCEYVITSELRGMDDVESATANHKQGVVEVSSDEDVERRELVRKVEKLGYAVGDSGSRGETQG